MAIEKNKFCAPVPRRGYKEMFKLQRNNPNKDTRESSRKNHRKQRVSVRERL